MRQAPRFVILMLVMSCAGELGTGVSAKVVGRNAGKVDVRISNDSGIAILLISPTKPNRQVDRERCSVLLSTRVQDWIRPYDFTPEVVEVESHENETFSIDLREDAPASCRSWEVKLEYAYVPAREGREVLKLGSSRFRSFVLGNQRMARMGT